MTSQREMMAVFVSRQIENGEYVSLGTNLPVPTAGVMLAHLTHAPDLRLNVLSYFTNLAAVERFDDLDKIANPAVAKWAEAVMSTEQMLNAVPRMDLCFAGGMQVDACGNSNLIGIRDQQGGWRLRGPGSVGTATVMSMVRRYFIFVSEHSPRTLVERCDYVSAVGWAEGGADARRRLGLSGGGPVFCITPRCVFDFHPESRRMRIRYLLPGVTVDDVLAATGFQPEVAADVAELPPPTAGELEVLRSRVDTRGVLRR